MNDKHDHDHDHDRDWGCGSGPGHGQPKRERIRYFTGRHMAARDFSDADDYHRSMRLLHNRLLHGWGIACGLGVRAHPRTECGVLVDCGLALDCHGREILLPRPVARRIPWDLLDRTSADEYGADGEDGSQQRQEQQGQHAQQAQQRPAEGGAPRVLLLCLTYCEEHTEKVPVLYGRNACSGSAYEDGRIREGHALHWHALDESMLDEYGWQSPRACAPGEDDGHCGGEDRDDGDGREPCCLDACCPRHACVPLAVIRGGPDDPVIDTMGRRAVTRDADRLTHVCWTSWTHGGYLSASQLAQVSVRFDRRLARAVGHPRAGPTGINERTFVMQAGEQREDLDFVMFSKPPQLLDDRRTAVFDVVDPTQYINHTVQVTLRCDFVLDCHGNPVDGTHLRGRLPSGNGAMGGNFESWFRVVSDDEYARLPDTAGAGGAKP